jgi:DNA-binding MarR family transcriptional regulator
VNAAASSDLVVEAGLDPELSALADALLSAMGGVRRGGRLVGRPSAFAGLTGAQLDLVRLVARRPDVSVAEAAAELRVAANTVSTLVRQLTDAGLLVRRVDVSDRRVARLELTPRMRAEAGGFRDRRVALLAHAIAELPPADRRRLADGAQVLTRLAARLPELAVPDA